MRTPHVEIYRSRDGYRWRLRAGNGQIVASGESHIQRSDARRAWATVKRLAPHAKVVK
jgi:uncharacterized protein YegP (UPF0339 family)